MVRRGLFSLIGLFGFLSSAWGWNKHQELMPFILSTPSPAIQLILERKAQAPCESDDKKALSTLIGQLQLNPETYVPSTVNGTCGLGTELSVHSVLFGSSVDDPDGGMDQNLPSSPGNSYDPHQDRPWMGGTQGGTSQGFRHMYFGGWTISHPITTFQIPLRALGQAPQRVEIMAQKAKELLKKGDLIWGTRVLGWAMHYVQDLNQPFHAVQIPHLRMVPWHVLLTWPPHRAFQQLVRETTRIITNFHYAFEGYTLNQVLKGDSSPFADCLSHPQNHATLKIDPSNPKDPKSLVQAILTASIQNAPRMGSSEIAFMGAQLIPPGADLTQTPDLLDYAELSTRPNLKDSRRDLNQVICTALANTSLATRSLLEWAFQP